MGQTLHPDSDSDSESTQNIRYCTRFGTLRTQWGRVRGRVRRRVRARVRSLARSRFAEALHDGARLVVRGMIRHKRRIAVDVRKKFVAMQSRCTG